MRPIHRDPYMVYYSKYYNVHHFIKQTSFLKVCLWGPRIVYTALLSPATMRSLYDLDNVLCTRSQSYAIQCLPAFCVLWTRFCRSEFSSANTGVLGGR